MCAGGGVVLMHGHIGDAFFAVDAADFLLRRGPGPLAGEQQQPARAREPPGTEHPL